MTAADLVFSVPERMDSPLHVDSPDNQIQLRNMRRRRKKIRDQTNLHQIPLRKLTFRSYSLHRSLRGRFISMSGVTCDKFLVILFYNTAEFSPVFDGMFLVWENV